MMQLLIIDDAPEDLEFLTELADSLEDVQVAAFGSGKDALDHFHEHGADCVFLDYRLEGEDGLAILAAFRARSHFLPVFLMSGHHTDQFVSLAEKAGANSVLQKENITAKGFRELIISAIGDSEEKRGHASLDRGERQVLLIEDNADDRDMIADMIRDIQGRVKVHAVGTGDDALAFFKKRDVDCTILDYRLDAEDGLTVLTKIKDIDPFHPVIMLTGQGNEDVAATSIKAGASDYLIKQRLTRPYLKTAIENAMSRTFLEAKVADQEEERRRFLNVLVHDLRAPLRNVRALGESASKEAISGNVTQLESLLATQDAVTRRAAELVDALEIYALLDGKVTFRPVSLDQAALAAKENLAVVIAESNATVDIQELPVIEGHLPQLTQMFQNLIENAIKYNNADRPNVLITSDASDHFIVRDNGIGISPRHFEVIFAPLKRLWSNGSYEGTGLGLATCKKIVERHGGEIWCTSKEGEGSDFHICIPKRAK